MRSSTSRATCCLLAAACGASPAPGLTPEPAPPPPTVATAPWPLPAGWRAESFPFPLEFAPSLAHEGVEELRFSPGMFDPAAAGYFTYAFVWRTGDAAALTPAQLADELTAYFRGLLVAVDGDKHRITDPMAIRVEVDAALAIHAHVIDAFASGQPLDLDGVAARVPCGAGALWRFAFAPHGHDQKAVREVAEQAVCGQPVLSTAH